MSDRAANFVSVALTPPALLSTLSQIRQEPRPMESVSVLVQPSLFGANRILIVVRPPTPLSSNVTPHTNKISQLGWSQAEAQAVRDSLMSFADDWNAPGMDSYDAL